MLHIHKNFFFTFLWRTVKLNNTQYWKWVILVHGNPFPPCVCPIKLLKRGKCFLLSIRGRLCILILDKFNWSRWSSGCINDTQCVCRNISLKISELYVQSLRLKYSYLVTKSIIHILVYKDKNFTLCCLSSREKKGWELAWKNMT